MTQRRASRATLAIGLALYLAGCSRYPRVQYFFGNTKAMRGHGPIQPAAPAP